MKTFGSIVGKDLRGEACFSRVGALLAGARCLRVTGRPQGTPLQKRTGVLTELSFGTRKGRERAPSVKFPGAPEDGRTAEQSA